MKLRPTSLATTRWLLLASLCCNVVFATYVSVQWLRPGWISRRGRGTASHDRAGCGEIAER